MKELIFASNNLHKLEEVRRIFKLYKVVGLRDIGFNKEIVEDGYDLEENAFIKARAVMEYIKEKGLNCAVLSDDSGLFVKALNYEPGIYFLYMESSQGIDEPEFVRKIKIENYTGFGTQEVFNYQYLSYYIEKLEDKIKKLEKRLQNLEM